MWRALGQLKYKDLIDDNFEQLIVTYKCRYKKDECVSKRDCKAFRKETKLHTCMYKRGKQFTK